jgi:DNA-binding transcriptional MerR regulator
LKNYRQQKRWNSADIDFFDSNFDDKFAFIDEAVIHANKNIYYRNVHVFVERIKKMIIMLESKMIKKNLSSCFRESILMWHIAKLFDVSRRNLFYEENMNEWVQTFIARFKTEVTTTTINLLKKRYTLTNAERNRESREYAQKIIRWVKFAKMTSTFNQLNIVYNEIDAELRRDLKKSFKDTTIDDYLQFLNDCKNIWWFLVKRNQKSAEYFTNLSYNVNKLFLFNLNVRFYDNRFEFLNQQRYNNWNQQKNQKNQFFNQLNNWKSHQNSYQNDHV